MDKTAIEELVARFRERIALSYAPILRVITGNPALKVDVGSIPMTDGKTVLLTPPWEMAGETKFSHDKSLCGQRDGFIQKCKRCRCEELVDASVFHEATHIVKDSFGKATPPTSKQKEVFVKEMWDRFQEQYHEIDFEDIPDVVKMFSQKIPVFKTFWNVVEDIHVDGSLVKVRPGVAILRQAIYQMALETGIVQKDGSAKNWSDAPKPSRALMVYYCIGMKVTQYAPCLGDDVKDLVDDPVLKVLAAAAFAAPTPADRMMVTLALYDRMKELDLLRKEPEQEEENDDGLVCSDPFDFDPPPDSESEEQGESDESEEGDSGDPSEEDSDEEEGDDEFEGGSDGEADTDDEDEDDPNASGGQGDEDFDDEEQDEGEEPEADADGEPCDSGSESDEEAESTSDGESQEDDDSEEEGEDEGEGSASDPDSDEEGNDDSESEDSAGDEGDDGSTTFEEDEEEDEEPEEHVDEITDAEVEEIEKALERFAGHSKETDDDDPYQYNPSIEEVELMKLVAGRLPWMELDIPSYPIQAVNNEPLALYGTSPINVGLVAPVVNKMKAILSANSNTRLEKSLKRGARLDSQHLARIPMEDYRIFAKRSIPDKRDWFVLVSIDTSGSTGSIIGEIRMLANNLGWLLHSAGVRFSMYTNDCDYLYGQGTNGDLAVGLRAHTIKGPREPWQQVSPRVNSIHSGNNNLDGQNMAWCRYQISQERAARKMIIYVTDGAMPDANAEAELPLLKHHLAALRREGVDLSGVGLRTDSPSKHGLDTIEVDDANDLTKLVQGLGARLI